MTPDLKEEVVEAMPDRDSSDQLSFGFGDEKGCGHPALGDIDSPACVLQAHQIVGPRVRLLETKEEGEILPFEFLMGQQRLLLIGRIQGPEP